MFSFIQKPVAPELCLLSVVDYPKCLKIEPGRKGREVVDSHWPCRAGCLDRSSFPNPSESLSDGKTMALLLAGVAFDASPSLYETHQAKSKKGGAKMSNGVASARNGSAEDGAINGAPSGTGVKGSWGGEGKEMRRKNLAALENKASRILRRALLRVVVRRE